MLVRSNHRIQSTMQLSSFSQLSAFEYKILKTQRPSREILTKCDGPKETHSPCEQHFIPPQEILVAWKAELDQAKRANARCSFYMECEFGLYTIPIINAAMQLHKAKEIRRAVTQEIDWLSGTCRIPTSVDSVPSVVLLNDFHSKIHNSSFMKVLPGIDMTPE